MSEDKSIILIKAVKELNIGMGTIVDFLAAKGFKVEKQPMAKLDNDMYTTLLKEFAADKIIKEEAKQISIGKIRKDEPGYIPEKPIEQRRSRDFENEEILIKGAVNFVPPVEKPKPEPPKPEQPKVEERSDVTLPGVKVIGKIDLDAPVPQPEKKEEPVAEIKKEIVPEVKVEPKEEIPQPPKPEPIAEKIEIPQPKVEEVKPEPVKPEVAPEPEGDEVIRAKAERLTGPNVVGKIQLPVDPVKRNQPVASSSNTAGNAADHKRNRKRKDNQHGGGGGGRPGGEAGGQHPQQGQGQGQGGGNRPGFNRVRVVPAEITGLISGTVIQHQVRRKKNLRKKIYKTRLKPRWPV